MVKPVAKLVLASIFFSGTLLGESGSSFAMKPQNVHQPTESQLSEHSNAEEIYSVAKEEAVLGNRSAQRSLRLLEETQDILAQSGTVIFQQGEQIDNVRNGVAAIDLSAKHSERKIDSINSVWGSLANKVKPEPKLKKSARFSFKKLRPQKKESKKEKSKKAQTTNISKPGLTTPTPGTEQEQYMELMNQNENLINQMHLGLENIKQQSLAIGEELMNQNERLDSLQRETDRANERMGKVIRRTTALLK